MSKASNRKQGQGSFRGRGSTGGSRLRRIRPATSPLLVTQGAEKDDVGIDWITATCPTTDTGPIVALLVEVLGGTVTPGGGKSFYRRGLHWDCGASVSWTHVSGADSVMVDVPGSVCQAMTGVERVQFLRRIMSHGFRVTRLDLAVDIRGGRARGFTHRMREAFKRGEICGARTMTPHDQHHLHGECEQTTYFGKRGSDGSGRYVRFYDKGLQTGTEKRAEQWMRWEAQFSQDCATLAALELVSAEDDDLDGGCTAGLAMACIDFRNVVNGETAVLRRPRCSWWAELVDRLKLTRVVAPRRLQTLTGYVAHLRRAVVPRLLRMCDDTGLQLVELLGVLGVLEGVRPGRPNVVTWQLRRALDAHEVS